MSLRSQDNGLQEILNQVENGSEILLVQVPGNGEPRLTQTNLHLCACQLRELIRSFLDTESMHTRNTGGLLVLLSRSGEEATSQHASNLAHTHLRVHYQRGVMLLDGVKPQTPLYALEQDNSEGYPSLSLTPIY